MFLTTVRVRRPKKATLDKYLKTRQLKTIATDDIVEVMAHGETVALVDLTALGNVIAEKKAAILWRHDAVKNDPMAVLQAVEGAVVLMQAAKDGGMCERPALAEKSPKAVGR